MGVLLRSGHVKKLVDPQQQSCVKYHIGLLNTTKPTTAETLLMRMIHILLHCAHAKPYMAPVAWHLIGEIVDLASHAQLRRQLLPLLEARFGDNPDVNATPAVSDEQRAAGADDAVDPALTAEIGADVRRVVPPELLELRARLEARSEPKLARRLVKT